MGHSAASRDWLKDDAPLVLLGLVLLVSAFVLLTYSAHLSFFQDSWEFLMNRRGLNADAFLLPHNEHIVVIPAAIAQLLLRIFGMSSAMPEFVTLTVFLLVSAVLVFVYVRRRVGAWPALMATVLLLFLGPAWQVLLWPFEIGFVGSFLFGVAMLLALDRDDRRSDVVACVFLALSIGFSSLGLAFAMGAVVDVLQRRRDRGLRRAYVAAVPLALYLVWYLGWGREAQTHLSVHNALVSPRFVGEGLSASTDSLLGLSAIASEAIGRSHWGPVLLGLLLALVVYGQIRKPGVSPSFWPVAAATATFWFLAAFNYLPGREAYSSRYLYAGAGFLLLLAADLLKGVRFGRWALLVGAVVTVVAAVSNLVPLREGRDLLERQTVLTRSDLAAIEIAQGTIDPAFTLTPEVAGTPFLNEIVAEKYLPAAREYGSPAYTPVELADAPEAGRQQADVVLANALPVTIEFDVGPVPGDAQRRCVEIRGGGASAPLRLRPGVTTIELGPGEPGTIGLRRFATRGYPLETGEVEAGSTTLLRIPPDRSARPWRLRVDAAQDATVCR